MALQSLQTPLEVARIDRPEKDLNEPRQTAPFVGRDCAGAGCSDDRGHRARKICGIAHRRELERRDALAPWRRNAVEAHPQRRRVAVEGEFDGLTRQGLRLAVQQQLHGACGAVSRSARAPGRVAGLTLYKGPPSLLLLFFHRIISH